MTVEPGSLDVSGLRISARTPAVIVPVTASTAQEVLPETREAVQAGADLVEWRVDRLVEGREVDPATVVRTAESLREVLGAVPLLVTVRTVAEGGYGPDDATYVELLLTVLEAGVADLIDVEYRRDGAARLLAAARTTSTPVVTSFHDFSKTPPAEEIEAILADQEAMGAAVAKVAVMPKTSADVAELLLATARRSAVAEVPLITMSMAGQGAISRIAGHVFGSAATFGMVGRPSAPGQIPVAELKALMVGASASSRSVS